MGGIWGVVLLYKGKGRWVGGFGRIYRKVRRGGEESKSLLCFCTVCCVCGGLTVVEALEFEIGRAHV